ncbi:hypothetical protein [Evansella tamaricis]|uniref:Uncharacterized protein n=1 Tax=Evansella tamaricis TaxID=2069301 RepID=A0ABS6JGM7_9BACI|nr:hypothetical protein [Evansella tamaricis]MBU9712798.1 hypothetical protein [Evansella tamaricis]
MTELELLKVILHKLARIEKEMVKTSELDGLIQQMICQEENLESVHCLLDDLKTSIEIKHLENINSDEFLLRSIREPVEL